MSARASTHFMLTLKGTEELSARTYGLDARLRNILFLIQKGASTVEAILQSSIFPPEEVVEKLRGLLKEHFVELGAGAAAPPAPAARADAHAAGPATVAGAGFARTAAPVSATLEPGISMSQARFLLSDFCLDQFGTKAQPLVDAIAGAADVGALQRVLDSITTEIRKHLKAQLPALLAKIREINETGA